ncbi:MAG: sensor histidine kinase [Arachnia sp.]
MTLAIAILLYSIPVYRSVKAGWAGYLIASIAELLTNPWDGVGFEITVGADGSITSNVVSAGSLLLFTAIPVILGINAGNRQRYLNALVEHAHQLARERDHLTRLAVAEERTRIAREMHDIVAHSVSVMVTLSEGAANVIDESPEDATSAMHTSAETGRSALFELRSLIRILREGDDAPAADIAPTPGITALPHLVQGFRDAGLEVALTLTGAPVEGADRREQGREVAIFRAVQEALTNTLRHAGPSASVSVSVHQSPSMTTVVIEDDGGVPGHARPMSSVGAGAGLLGLAERLRLFQGELVAGPTPSGGWKVTVTMPTLSTEEDSDA